MEFETPDYRRMMQVIQNAPVCRVAAVLDGRPYVVPMCCCCHMDGCVPVFEMYARNDGDLVRALEGCADVMLEMERPHLGGTDTVLVRGRAEVMRRSGCGGGRGCDARDHYDDWPVDSDGRARFTGRGGQDADGWSARRGGCAGDRGARWDDDFIDRGGRYTDAPRQNNGCRGCNAQNSGSCPLCAAPGDTACDRQTGAIRIWVRADEMSGRHWDSCTTHCRH